MVGVSLASLAIEVPRAVVGAASGKNVLFERAVAAGGQLLAGTSESIHASARFFSVRRNAPDVSAEAYLVGDLSTGEILFSRAEKKPMPIASVTKLFSAAVADAKSSSSVPLPVSHRAVSAYGTAGNLVAGESLSSAKLLYPLLLESSNDAAEALAEGYGRDSFIADMNAYAKEAGLSATSFADPSGLSPSNVSTAEDLFSFARTIFLHGRDIIAITRTEDQVLSRSENNRYHRWLNANYFVRAGDPLYDGGKTGYTPEAAQTAVLFFSVPVGQLDTRDLAVVILGSGARNRDAALLLDAATSGEYTRRSKSGGVLVAGGAGVGHDESPAPLSLVFVGDIMTDRGVRKSVEARGGDYSRLFSQAEYLSGADIAFGNLEGPLSDRGYDLGSVYSFRMEPASLSALSAAGVDVVSVANNHMGDWGRGAFEDTLARLGGAKIEAAGGGFSRRDAKRPRVIIKNGVSVGFLAFSDLGPHWLASDPNESYMLDAGDTEYAAIIADAARAVDALVVSLHFGDEYESMPNERQRTLARAAIDAGARIVIGHHPHVIQPIEEYNGGIIAYSLGNFIFDQTFSEETRNGLVLEILLERDTIVRVNPRRIRINDEFTPLLLE